MNKILFVLKFLESNIGKKLIGNVSDETVYTILLNLLSGFGVKDDTIKLVITIMQQAKGDDSWGKVLTDSEFVSSVRELLNDFNNLSSNDETIIERM